MSKKETPTGAATSAGARAETAACGRAAISSAYYSTDKANGQFQVSDVLLKGEKNAQTMKELRRVLNGSSRSIRLEIERERQHGVPIVSDCQHGYWIAETRAELDRFCRSMRARAFEIQKTAALVQLADLEAG